MNYDDFYSNQVLYRFLREYIINNNVMNENKLTDMEINVLLNLNRDKPLKLDKYFKWLFKNNNNNTKLACIKEIERNLDPDDLHIFYTIIADEQHLGGEIDYINKCAKENNLNK